MDNLSSEYRYVSPEPGWPDQYLWEPLLDILLSDAVSGKRIFEVGCGNGSTANKLAQNGFEVIAIDPSTSGIATAKQHFPNIRFEEGSAYDDLQEKYGKFPIVLSLEVVEHCFWPKKYAATIYELLDDGGTAVISTPYHGYIKNLALAFANRYDHHWSPLWDGGHIKFWSIKTLTRLLRETGFSSVEFVRVGRIPPLAKSMIAIAKK